ncbi:MAG: glycoside hydrolase family 3 protein [Oscillospiraceae bacterium]|nr:glycoside hydrolase family 3 protein [Oscillospiraceae bacterium]MBQ6316056.1 glycoside hydrolase family 3 protein [Oscillospiraceae bacterium]
MDRPYILNADAPLLFDFNDPDSQYVMFDRELEGRFLLTFSEPMALDGGRVLLHGRPLDVIVRELSIGEYRCSVLAVDLAAVLHDYGQKAVLHIEGYRDRQGAEMLPAEISVYTPEKVFPEPRFAAHEQIALQAAQDGIVLLKNEKAALPLPAGETLNFFGKDLFCFRLCAVGAGKITPRYAIGLLEAAEAEAEHPLNRELLDFYACGENRIPNEAMLKRAREASDTALFVLSRCSGENTDNASARGEYTLTEAEEALLAALREHFDRLVVILNVGYPIAADFAERFGVDAVVYNGFGGMLAGRALMDVLTGRVNPSGKLPDTWAARYEDLPASHNFYDCGDGKPRLVTDEGETWVNTVYEEDIYLGYRYFETFPEARRGGFPFGHGLSYTRFEKAAEAFAFDGDTLRVTVRVTNTGAAAGREAAQLYLSKPQGRLEQPARELVEFEKTLLLAPGESEMLTMSVPLRRMASFDEEAAAWVAAEGSYCVFLGGSVREAEEIGRFTLEADRVLRRVKRRMRPNLPFTRMTQRDPAGTYPKGELSGVADVDSLRPARENVERFSHTELPRSGRRLTFRDVLADESLLEELVGNLDVKTLCRLSVCANHGWGVEGRGEAGRLYAVDGLELPDFVVADGNSGVNLHDRNIGFPSGATLCASFDKELMEDVGRVIGEEAKALGISLILAPGMNLHRNPLNGRQPEYFSEDPYLAGTMAGHYCKGLESTGVGGCYKHLIANNAESARKRNQSVISERAIRELYFRAFQIALEVHEPISVMTAYNAVNGLFTSCDAELIQGLLFEECGFEGFVMTDWCSYDSADVAEMAIAGNSWITPGSEDDTYTAQLEAAVADGRLSLAQLQQNVLRLLRALLILEKGEWNDAAI